jgi:hypothetical protein
MLNYENLVRLLDDQVDRLLPAQVMDSSRADFGGFVSDGIAQPTSVSSLSSLAYAYALEESRHYGCDEILSRILAGAAFGRHIRRDSGCFDLLPTNFDSSPDTGFMVKALAPAVRAVRSMKGSGAEEVENALGDIIRAAVPGMVSGGFHTPNHRWVLVAALSQALTLYPDLEGMHVVEQYLAETIDVNEDGEFIERSAGGYNAIINRSLRLAAEALNRPELLEPVRKNLDLSYHLLHADGTVVTSFSKRQDHGQRIVLIDMVDSYYHLARHDENGFYGAVADWLFSIAPGNVPWALQPFVDHPEWREDDLERETLPDQYAKIYPTARIWRVRRGETSATAGAGSPAPFSVRQGNVELTSVSTSASYFAIAQFSGETFSETDGRIRMTHQTRGDFHDRPVYYLPVGEPVGFEEFFDHRQEREVYALPPLETALEIEEVQGGFDIGVSCTGYDRVPFQIACDFAPGGEVELGDGSFMGRAGEEMFLKSKELIYRVGNDAISIGPGQCAHQFRHMRGSEPAPNAFRVLITLVTPVEHTLQIRCGKWSLVEERLCP